MMKYQSLCIIDKQLSLKLFSIGCHFVTCDEQLWPLMWNFLQNHVPKLGLQSSMIVILICRLRFQQKNCGFSLSCQMHYYICFILVQIKLISFLQITHACGQTDMFSCSSQYFTILAGWSKNLNFTVAHSINKCLKMVHFKM